MMTKAIRPDRTERRGEQGSSLVEVLVATLIFTVAFLNIAEMMVYAISVTRNADMTTTLTAAALEKLEEFRATDYNAASLAAVAPTQPQEDPVPTNADISRMWTIEDNTPYNGMKRITVTVATVANTYGNVRSLTLVAMRTQTLTSDPVH